VTTHADATVWLARLRAEHGIDDAYDETASWPFRIGRFIVPVPNFSWRRAAIQRHDLHHILNGFPFNMRGEFQVATWEFAAGRYPHLGATLLLLPLVTLGLLWSPRAIWRAFMKGRGARSLYHPDMLAVDLPALRDLVAGRVPAEAVEVRPSDMIAFGRLVLQSAAIIIAPIGVCAAVLAF
jgi:hypothetical protein